MLAMSPVRKNLVWCKWEELDRVKSFMVIKNIGDGCFVRIDPSNSTCGCLKSHTQGNPTGCRAAVSFCVFLPPLQSSNNLPNVVIIEKPRLFGARTFSERMSADWESHTVKAYDIHELSSIGPFFRHVCHKIYIIINIIITYKISSRK